MSEKLIKTEINFFLSNVISLIHQKKEKINVVVCLNIINSNGIDHNININRN